MRVTAEKAILEHEGATRFAFAPDGKRFVVGDSTGRIVIRSADDGAALVTAQVPLVGAYEKRAHVHSIAWSPDGAYIATIDNATTVRLRRSEDLSVVSELDGFGALDHLAFGGPSGGGASFLAVANRELRIRAVPSLDEIRTMPIARKKLDTFDVYAIACAPRRPLVVTCDIGGYSEDERDTRIDSDAPRTGIFDIDNGTVRWLEKTEREEAVHFDRFRDRILTVSYANGTTIWSPDGTRLRYWWPYVSRKSGDYVPYAAHLAVAEPFLVTIPDRHARAKLTVDLWDPTSFASLASADFPKDEEVHAVAVSPDGSRIVTSMREPGTVRDHGIRLWRVD